MPGRNAQPRAGALRPDRPRYNVGRVRVLKWVSLGFGAILALAVIGVLLIVWFVDPNRFKPRIEAAVRDATGREFALKGDIDLGFFPWLALRAGQGSFGNAPGFGPDPLATWQSAQLGVRLIPLLRGELVIDRVRLSGADVRLVRHADGHGNWEGIGSDAPAEPAGNRRDVSVDGVEIRDSRVSFVDEGTSQRIEVTALDLTTDEIKLGEPFTDTEIEGRLHMDGFAADGVPFRLAVPKAELAKDYASFSVDEFAAKFGGFETEGAVRGELGEKMNLAGSVDTNEFDLSALLRTVGIEPPKTTDPKALGRISARATWAFDAGAIQVDPLALTLDDTKFTGNFRLGAGEDAIGEFLLSGDSLDIARYVPPTDPQSEPFVLPTAQLKALRFRGVIELATARYDDILMKGVTLRLLLDESGLRSESKAP